MARGALGAVGKVKYKFGGNDVKGGQLDCSSFTQAVFKNAGVDIGRTASAQAKVGTPIKVSRLQPGDLVFFQNTYKKGVSHVGIYAGDGQFINNSSSKKGVVVDNLSDKYWQQHWYGARRVV